MKIFICFLTFLFTSSLMNSQSIGWHLDATDKAGSLGISANNLYKDILKDRPSSTVVVAVIDSGVDVEHEDLKENIWVNADEIPDNGIDDDGNGYIDDIHGWNFIGGPDGNVHHETYEATRIYGAWKYKYENANPTLLSKKEKEKYDIYMACKEEVEKKLASAKGSLENIENTESVYMNSMDAIKDALNGNDITLDNLKKIDGNEDRFVGIGKTILLDLIAREADDINIDSIKAMIQDGISEEKEYYANKVNYAYNVDFDSRKIVQDNINGPTEQFYGNNDVEGPDAFHGTHVAGIIGAVRNNDMGIDGIANNIRIMSVRTIPDGDERDKDVANAIKYAVDNGAHIINMSFGKGYSWNESIVEDAIKYAEKKDVLLVHASGNDGKNNDTSDNFPNDTYKGKGFLFFKPKEKTYNNWLEVGALSYMSDDEIVAPFSNYGQEEVDIFAPGMEIYSTIPDNQYKPSQGTSFAAPIVAGVAAVLRSYFPSLTAAQVKDVLMRSVTPINTEVIIPGTMDEMAPFSTLSVSGGVVNAEQAVKMAKGVKGKKKIKNMSDDSKA